MITLLSLLAFLVSKLPNIGPLDEPILRNGSAGVDQSTGNFQVTDTESVWTLRVVMITVLLSVAVILSLFRRSKSE